MLQRTYSIENTFYRDIFYSKHTLYLQSTPPHRQRAFYREHIPQRIHSIEDTFYKNHTLYLQKTPSHPQASLCFLQNVSSIECKCDFVPSIECKCDFYRMYPLQNVNHTLYLQKSPSHPLQNVFSIEYVLYKNHTLYLQKSPSHPLQNVFSIEYVLYKNHTLYLQKSPSHPQASLCVFYPPPCALVSCLRDQVQGFRFRVQAQGLGFISSSAMCSGILPSFRASGLGEGFGVQVKRLGFRLHIRVALLLLL